MINDSAATCLSLVKIVEEFTVQIMSFPDVSGQWQPFVEMPRLRRLLLVVSSLPPVELPRLMRLLLVMSRLPLVEMPRLRDKLNFEFLVIVTFVGDITAVRQCGTDAADVVQLYPGP